MRAAGQHAGEAWPARSRPRAARARPRRCHTASGPAQPGRIEPLPAVGSVALAVAPARPVAVDLVRPGPLADPVDRAARCAGARLDRVLAVRALVAARRRPPPASCPSEECPCSPPSRPRPCSGSTATRSPSRSTSPAACPASPSSARPTPSCREARDRVRAAVLSSGLDLAAAADHRQPGAVGAAQGRRRARPGHRHRRARAPTSSCRRRRSPTSRFIGELGLDGALRPRRRARCRWSTPSTRPTVVVPPRLDRRGRGSSAATGSGRPRTLRELVDALRGRRALARHRAVVARRPSRPTPLDLADVRGQPLGPPGPRGGRRRRAPPADDRPAGRGQDHAGPAPARPAARPRRRRCARGHPHPLRGRRAACRRAGWCGGRRSGRRTTARRRWR